MNFIDWEAQSLNHKQLGAINATSALECVGEEGSGFEGKCLPNESGQEKKVDVSLGKVLPDVGEKAFRIQRPAAGALRIVTSGYSTTTRALQRAFCLQRPAQCTGQGRRGCKVRVVLLLRMMDLCKGWQTMPALLRGLAPVVNRTRCRGRART